MSGSVEKPAVDGHQPGLWEHMVKETDLAMMKEVRCMEASKPEPADQTQLGFKEYDNNQLMMPSDLRDWLGDDHPARMLDDIVACLDLSEIRKAYSPIGQRAYSPTMMTKVWLYGYMTRVRSCRDLAKKLETDVAFMYLAGMQRPGFRTLDRFRVNHQEALKKVFVQVVQLCSQAGLVDLKQVSIDGTKMKANASVKRTRTAEQMRGEIAKAQAEFDQISEQIGQQDAAESYRYGKNKRGDELPDVLRDREKRIKFLKEQIEELNARGAKKINLSDSEATLQKMGTTIRPGYNAQVTVEQSHQVIVSCHVVPDAHDYGQLQSGIEGVHENLGSYPEQALADGGYHSGQNLKVLEDLNVDGYIPDPETRKQALMSEDKKPFHRNAFTYDPARDCYICPKGKTLNRHKTQWVNKKDHSKGKVTAYRGTDCAQCEAFNLCKQSPCGNARTVYRDEFESLREKHREKMNRPESQQIYKARQCTVEPPFANIKQNLGYRHFALRGLAKVNIEFTFMALAHNLKKLIFEATSKGVLWLRSKLETFAPFQIA